MTIDDLRDINKVLAGMNTHIPAVRRPLLELAEEAEPTYRTRAGDTVTMERSEIEYILNECSEMDKIRMKLPILVTTDISGDIPAWRVDGAAESRLVAKILKKPQICDGSIRFYNPEYQILRRILPTCAIIVYLP